MPLDRARLCKPHIRAINITSLYAPAPWGLALSGCSVRRMMGVDELADGSQSESGEVASTNRYPVVAQGRQLKTSA